MSDGYKSKQEMKAQDFNCALEFLDKNKSADISHAKNLTIGIYDLTSYDKNTNYCFEMDGDQEATICSGSKDIYKVLGPFNGIEGWSWKFKASQLSNLGYNIRFWIYFGGK